MTRGAQWLLLAAVAVFVLAVSPAIAEVTDAMFANHEQRITALEAEVGITTTTTQAPTTTTTQAPTTTTTQPPADSWRVGAKWQWQLQGTIDLTVNAEVFNIDYQQPASIVNALQAKGATVICYMSAGSWEDWRPDANQYPASVKGNNNGWPGEKWVDIRQWETLQPILNSRVASCKAKGFDAVEFDNVDGYTNNTGFPLTAADQATFNTRLAALAHSHGLLAGLKNDVEQVTLLEPVFDFAINEQCVQYNECGPYSVFIDAGKPVFHAEYSVGVSKMCNNALDGFSSVKKRLSLSAWARWCE